MAMPVTGFTVVVEEIPRMEFRITGWEGESAPDLIETQGKELLVLVGKYLEPGQRYRYRRPTKHVCP